jgi:hypothetical protein
VRRNQVSQSPSSTSFIDPETLSYIDNNYVKSTLFSKVFGSVFTETHAQFTPPELNNLMVQILQSSRFIKH